MTMYAIAYRLQPVVFERPGAVDDPFIQWCLSLCRFGLDAHDEIPWCSAFMNGVALVAGGEMTASGLARSWLGVGASVRLEAARVGWDVVILSRGSGAQPGPDDRTAPGHVGLFAGVLADGRVLVLGGNQADRVSIQAFDAGRILGIRRVGPVER